MTPLVLCTPGDRPAFIEGAEQGSSLSDALTYRSDCTGARFSLGSKSDVTRMPWIHLLAGRLKRDGTKNE